MQRKLITDRRTFTVKSVRGTQISSDTMANRKKDYPCIRCNEHVKTRTEAVECTLCNQWVHVKCEPDITPETYKALCAAAEARRSGSKCALNWSCASCSSYATKFNTSILELHMRLRKMEANCSENTKDIELVQKNMEILQGKVDAISVDSVSKNTTTTIFNEIRERDLRKNNVIIYNLDEPQGSNKEERLTKDKKSLRDLCDEIDVKLNLDEDCKFVTRLGKFDKEKTRPMLVGLHNDDIKRSILSNARKLNKTKDNIKISHDLTNQQRSEEKELLNEAETKNGERTEEEKRSFKFQVVGRKGEKRIARVPIEEDENSQRRERRTSARRRSRSPPRRGSSTRTSQGEMRSRSPPRRGSSTGSSQGEPSPKRRR